MFSFFNSLLVGLTILLSYLATIVSAVKPTGKYIIEFNKGNLRELSKRSFDNQSDEFSHFFNQLKSLQIDTISHFNFSHVFNGVTISFTDSSDTVLKIIKGLPIVDNVLKDLSTIAEFPSPEMTFQQNLNTDSNLSKRNTFKRSTTKTSSTTTTSDDSSQAVKAAQSSLASLPQIPWSSLDSTSVSQIHKKGITGKNVVIAFLDSGVEYNHEALKGRYLGGYDLVGDNFGQSNPVPSPDNDPNDTYGHGTEAVGVAVGSSKTFLGVAPSAKFRMYRILSSYDGGTTTDIILQGLEKAVQDGSDIINVSAGDPEGFTFSVVNRVVDNIVSKGIVVVFAAGNYGTAGPYYASAGASSLSSVGVGHTLTDRLVGWNTYIVSDKSNTPRAAAYVSASAGILPLDGAYKVDVIPNSLCTPNGAPKRNNSVLIIPASNDCSKATQYNVASSLGYTNVFYIASTPSQYLYNSYASPQDPLTGIAAYNSTDGAWIVDQHSRGASLTVVFNSSISPVIIDISSSGIPGVGLVNTVQSWGPTYDGFFYPDVSAPGGNVFAPTIDGKYKTVSGSSYSAPFVAGIAALYLEKNNYSKSLNRGAPVGTPEEFKRRLMSYSNVVNYYDGSSTYSGTPAPLIQQGAGMVNAYNALYCQSIIVDKPYLTVNSSANRYFFNYFEFNLKNGSPKKLSYTLSAQPAASVNTRDDKTLESYTFPPPTTADKKRIYFYESSFSLDPGATKTVRIALILDLIPAYENTCYTGKILIKPSEGDALGIPYLAFSENTKKNGKILIDPIIFIDSDYNPVDPSQYTYSLSDYYNFPAFFFGTNFGSSDLSFDVVSDNFNINSDIYGIISTTQCTNKNGCANSNKYYGTLYGVFDGTFRIAAKTSTNLGTWDFTSGGLTKPGKYRILTRALKPFGSRTKASDWEYQLSDTFTVAA
ncbi:uncharacterized protein SAPINGB_P004889 [Magnusiomyces paraingens]|uniref:Peptidase S8/S53 domain-containing protein n=1 Tax=Magnusiomyces paraingens TaxID=2606893 RepID=A0A5E8C359_9ASCO|nr:uncharacterized protein SAPINGB_P004889 [Saprochaete ingens]VVT56198.1 unnamed protein product [Saprochaete ingens]